MLIIVVFVESKENALYKEHLMHRLSVEYHNKLQIK